MVKWIKCTGYDYESLGLSLNNEFHFLLLHVCHKYKLAAVTRFSPLRCYEIFSLKLLHVIYSVMYF